MSTLDSGNKIIGAVIDFLGVGSFSDLKDPVILGLLSIIVGAAVTVYFAVTTIRISGISKLYLRIVSIFSFLATLALVFGVMYRRTMIPAYNYAYEALFSISFIILLYSTWYMYKLAAESRQIKNFENGIFEPPNSK